VYSLSLSLGFALALFFYSYLLDKTIFRANLKDNLGLEFLIRIAAAVPASFFKYFNLNGN